MTNNTYPKCYTKFRKSTIDKMKELVNKSQISEHGGTFCLDRELKVNLRDICKGDICGINIKGDCQQGEILAGQFHTHPHIEIPPFPSDIPSPGDWQLWTSRNYLLTCVGSKKVTKCYQKKKDLKPEEINRIKNIITDMDRSESGIDTELEPPDYQQPALRRYKKHNEKLEGYYHKFPPEECSE